MTFQTLMMLLGGLLLILLGANYLVEGASDIARRSGISEFVIGLTIVAIGTSAPEMVVSFISAFMGSSDISVGNIVGSNIFNTLLILGISAAILPIPVTRDNRRRDITVNIAASILLILLGLNQTIFGAGSNRLSRIDGAVMLAVFVCYMAIALYKGKSRDEERQPGKYNLALSIFITIVSIAALIWGGRLFVNSGVAIAKYFNVSEKFIAITLMAGGTSLPELVTCIIAAAKKKGSLALGNILGSNIFNILLILGGSALIHPLTMAPTIHTDLAVMLLSAIAVFACCRLFEKDKIDRIEGVLFVMIWLAYMTWLIIKL